MSKSAGKAMRRLFVIPLLAGIFMQVESQPAVAQAGNGFINRVFHGGQQQAGTMPGSGAVSTAVTPGETIHQLEEQVRQLTGKVEELNFMVLQMQTQIDELRHGGQMLQKPAAGAAPAENAAAVIPQASVAPRVSSSARSGRNDENAAEGAAVVPEGGNTIADVPQTDTPDELYAIGYQHVLAGDYRAAETVFRAFQTRFPQNSRVADASFWLGEALYGQGRYREAAQAYIDVQRNYQGTGHGPENLLKLGMSMARLDEKDVACVTLAEVPKRYQNADPALLTRVKEERSRIKCQ